MTPRDERLAAPDSVQVHENDSHAEITVSGGLQPVVIRLRMRLAPLEGTDTHPLKIKVPNLLNIKQHLQITVEQDTSF